MKLYKTDVLGMLVALAFFTLTAACAGARKPAAIYRTHRRLCERCRAAGGTPCATAIALRRDAEATR